MNEVAVMSSGISAKEDRDYLLDYKSIDLEQLGKQEILDVPVDNVTRDEAVAIILDMLEKQQGPHHVMFTDPLKLVQLRPTSKFYPITREADLILADGAGVGWAAQKLGIPLKERIPMIALLMDVIRLAELKEVTIYLLGSRQEYIEKVFTNLQRSFPSVRIIGRQGGYFDSSREELIKESLRKSSPDIIFVGMGFPDQEIWINENREFLSKAIVFSVDGAFDVLSGKERKAPDWFQLRGLAWLWRLMMRPYALNRVFYLNKFLFLTYWKTFQKKRAAKFLAKTKAEAKAAEQANQTDQV